MDSKVKKALNTYTSTELMVVRASQELANSEIVFVGIGLPNLACVLARETHAPNLFMIYESGAIGTTPERLPISIGDPCLVTGSLSIVSQADIFQTYLQSGRIEVGFLGGAQIDRWGNINTTVIGDYENPSIRLPGSGGACEIAAHSRKLLIVMKMSAKTFVDRCDYITSPGHKYYPNKDSEPRSRSEFNLPGPGPTKVVTDLGVLEFIDGEMTLTEIYPNVTAEDVKSSVSWDLCVAAELRTTPSPSEETLKKLRLEVDPDRLYLN